MSKKQCKIKIINKNKWLITVLELETQEFQIKAPILCLTQQEVLIAKQHREAVLITIPWIIIIHQPKRRS